jgi:hypothetical protein
MQLLKNLQSVIYCILFIPLLSSCLITVDINKLNDRMFKKYDKNQNHAFEQTEFLPILKNIYKFEKQRHNLIDQNIRRDDYLNSEFLSYDDNHDGHVTLAEIQSYDRKKYFTLKDENKNGYLDLVKEILFLTEKRVYMSWKIQKVAFVKDGKRIISYEDYLIKVKKGLDTNLDNRVSLEEYQNFMPIYCGC